MCCVVLCCMYVISFFFAQVILFIWWKRSKMRCLHFVILSSYNIINIISIIFTAKSNAETKIYLYNLMHFNSCSGFQKINAFLNLKVFSFYCWMFNDKRSARGWDKWWLTMFVHLYNKFYSVKMINFHIKANVQLKFRMCTKRFW